MPDRYQNQSESQDLPWCGYIAVRRIDGMNLASGLRGVRAGMAVQNLGVA